MHQLGLWMKLFINDNRGQKRYLNLSAASRRELAAKLGSEYFSVDNVTYHVSQVLAEKSNDATPVSIVIGGALGLVGGMPGVIIGGVLGALFGSEADKKVLSEIEAFNRSSS
jgi:hypothetical protein